MSRLIIIALSSVLLGTLSGCAYQPNQSPQEAYEALEPSTPAENRSQADGSLPAAVSEYLSQPLRSSDGTDSDLVQEQRFVLQAKGLDAREFFYSLTIDTPYNIIVHPDVEGEISLDLKDVTIAETLAVIEDTYGYEIKQTGRMIQVFPSGVRTKTFSLDYLSLKRFGMSQTQISSGGVSQNDNDNSGSNSFNNSSNNSNFNNPGLLGGTGRSNNSGNLNQSMQGGNGASVSSQSETDLWGELQDMLEKVAGGGSVVMSPQAGIVSVTAQPSKLRAVGEFLSTLQTRIQRQVILEARIVEVTLADGFEQGIQWSELDGLGESGFDFSFNGARPSNLTDVTSDGLFGLRFNDNNFSSFLSLLQTQGSVQVLSNPRVSASNNQKAVIKIGEDEYYVTDVQSQTNSSGLNDALTSSDVELTPFFSGISLDVTPQISDDDVVTLHVHPSVVETAEQEKVIEIGDETLRLPLARSNIRESDTIVRARNGEIVVLGGLMQTSTTEDIEQVPLMGDLPLIGNLFKNRVNRTEKKELVILIKPTVIGADTWREELQRSQDLLKAWFPDLAN
ncbi:MAG: pilus (MSHA type) biogenesis protein MshL [Idiomarina sp.]|uniref:pilus (MSHA type) biogenesis protein MshL n=1 Tax=Idiomarina sp. TaxID=1874361 RepID=UPI000C3E4B49|nr:pilus (MSHA type) biogenesis protein MshL [Idiomarina sp.]MBT42127.1 pilus (MSHA type) biogenesis protein MshL [Idiomarina sp.]